MDRRRCIGRQYFNAQYPGLYPTQPIFYGGTGINYWTDGFWEKACQELNGLA